MNAKNAIVIKETSNELQLISQMYADSGYFPDTKSRAQAFVKITAGREMGVPAMAAMTGIAIIQGKPVVGAHLIASKVKMSGYDYRVREFSNTKCTIEFFSKDGESLGKSSFTEEDAKKAGLLNKDNWKKYPRNMYFARAMANGQKWYCPDATLGMVVYTPDELGGKVDNDGNPVVNKNGKAIMDAEFETIEPTPEPEKKKTTREPKKENNKNGDTSSNSQRSKMFATMRTKYKMTDKDLKPVMKKILGKDFEHSADLTTSEISHIIDALEEDPKIWVILGEVKKELKASEVDEKQGALDI